MADRITRETDAGYYDFVLASAAVAVKGEIACGNTATGTVRAAGTATTLIPIGYFAESFTGDGTKKVSVRFFRERKLHWFKNDGTDPVLAANVFSNVYIVDGGTVSISSATNTRSIAGRAMALDSKLGVLVAMADG